jgi:adenine phosphoribosyltransferase
MSNPYLPHHGLGRNICRILISDSCLGGSAAAAGSLVKQLGGNLLGYCFILELEFLEGRKKLDAPVYTLLSGQDKSSS